MIFRQWRGLARTERADEYVQHLRRDTFPQLARIPGFVDASILRRDVERGVEFLVVTRWRSLDAIRKFAGADAEIAVVPENVQRMMLDYDRRVAHYELVE
ncbi:MAG TPA: antibiotic biosynthesis monooxygenase [Burkholderiales bacterium]